MRCYKCNSKLAEDKPICTKCGADITFYKKICYTSNAYYNQGLDKARARDLTGAAESLRLCLQLNKKNVNARNLLGLVYYEMGEAALALKEWVVSRNYQYRSNTAERYISDLKDNRQALDGFDHSIRKFNQALEYAQTGAKDLAVIQLKKVIAVNPRMLKAYQLLALLYIEQKKYGQAKTTLKKCLEIDRGNICALSYLRELRKVRGANEKENEVVGETDREEVIIPVRLRDYGSYLATAAYILIGALLALGILYYIVIPGKEQQIQSEQIERLNAYEARITELNSDIAVLEDQVADLEEKNKELKDDLSDSNSLNTSTKKAYDELLSVAELYISNDLLLVADAFSKLDVEGIEDEVFLRVYEGMKTDIETTLADRLMTLGHQAREARDLEKALEYYDAVAEIRPEDEGAIFYKAVTCQEAGRYEEAADLYMQIINEYPESPYRMDSEFRVDEIAPGRRQEANPPANESQGGEQQGEPGGEEQPPQSNPVESSTPPPQSETSSSAEEPPSTEPPEETSAPDNPGGEENPEP